jgi:hypothetical protein
MGMHSHILGYPSILGRIPIYWCTPVNEKTLNILGCPSIWGHRIHPPSGFKKHGDKTARSGLPSPGARTSEKTQIIWPQPRIENSSRLKTNIFLYMGGRPPIWGGAPPCGGIPTPEILDKYWSQIEPLRETNTWQTLTCICLMVLVKTLKLPLKSINI